MVKKVNEHGDVHFKLDISMFTRRFASGETSYGFGFYQFYFKRKSEEVGNSNGPIAQAA